MLSDRQELILKLVIADYLERGRPVGSKALAQVPDISWGPSTVRAELAVLEAAGYLTHPHTSAGRIPTERGYRIYVDSLISSGELPASHTGELAISELRHEIDETMRETTSALARFTDLIALVTAPPLETATIHRVEVLRLRPNVLMVVVITSTGVVTKKTLTFEQAIDPGLVSWASSYLNESLVGMGIGARMIASRLSDPDLSPVEAAFLGRLSVAFTNLDPDSGEALYVDGAGRLMAEASSQDLPGLDKLMQALESRAAVLNMLRSVLDERSIFLWIGHENPRPELRGATLVGANYGLGHRNLGTVGLVGPVRMDYPTAIASVREAARELSHYFEAVYEN